MAMSVKSKMNVLDKLKLIDKIADKMNKKAGKTVMGRIAADPEIAKALDIQFIPTASPDLNRAVGGGFPRGRCTLVVGTRDSGKTSLALESIGKAMAQDPDLVAAWVESENSLGKKQVCDDFDIDPERFVFIPVNAGVQAEITMDMLYDIIKTGAVDMVVINSLRCLIPKHEMEASLGDTLMADSARFNSRITKKFNAVVSEMNTAFVMITHLSTAIGSYGDPFVISGGEAIQYWSQLTIDLRKKTIGDKDPIKREEGVKIGVTVRKNHVQPDKFPYVKLDYYALFGEGIETIMTALDAAMTMGIVVQGGAYYTWYDTEGHEIQKWCGRTAFRNYMKDNPNEFAQFSEAVYPSIVKNVDAEEAKILEAEEQIINESVAGTKSKKKTKAVKTDKKVKEKEIHPTAEELEMETKTDDTVVNPAASSLASSLEEVAKEA